MILSEQIAKQLTELYFGGNWTDSNLKDCLADVTWEIPHFKYVLYVLYVLYVWCQELRDNVKEKLGD